MKRSTRTFGYALLLLAGLAVGTAALLATHGREWLRAEIERRLQARVVPTVRVVGPVDLRLWPVPTLAMRDLRIGDAATAPVLTVREITAELDVSALMGGQLALSSLSIDGAGVVLRRDVDGRWNVAGWLRSDPLVDPSAGGGVAIRKLAVAGTTVRIDAGGDAPAVELTELRLDAGPLAPAADGKFELRARAVAGAPFDADLRIAASGRYRFDGDGAVLEDLLASAAGGVAQLRLDRGEARAVRLRWQADKGASLSGASAAVAVTARDAAFATDVTVAALGQTVGGWHGESLHAEVRAERAGQKLEARLDAPAPRIDAYAWRLPDATLRLTTSGTAPPVTLSLAGAVVGGMGGEAGSEKSDKKSDEKSDEKGDEKGSETGSDARGKTSGKTRSETGIGLGDATIDVTIARGDVELPHPAGDATTLAVSFAGTAQIDPASRRAHGDIAGRFDRSRFDGRWRLDPAATPPLSVSLAVDRLDLDRYLPPPAAKTEPADLTAWRNWPVAADLRVGRLQLGGLVSENVRLQLVGDAGASPGTAARGGR